MEEKRNFRAVIKSKFSVQKHKRSGLMIRAKKSLTKERKPSGKLSPPQPLKISRSTKSSRAKPEEQ